MDPSHTDRTEDAMFAQGRTGGLNAWAQRRQNRSIILQHLLVGGPMPRQQLASATGLTQASICRIADDLLASHLLVERDAADPRAGGRRRPGPRSSMLDLNETAAAVLSIFLDADSADLGVHDLRARVLRRKRVRVDRNQEPERVLLRLRQQALRLAAAAGAEDTVVGLGMGIPAGVDNEGRIILSQPWRDVPAAEILARDMRFQVVVDRIQRGMATAEAWFGAGVGAHILVAVHLAESVGCGIAIDGGMLKGHNYLEGHIGHLPVPGGRRPCPSCGRPGCLGTEIKDSVIAEEATERLGLPAGSTTEAAMELLYERARADDAGALELLASRCRHIGYALAHISTIVDPTVITLGGPSVVGGWDLLAPMIASEWTRQSPLPSVKRRTRLVLTPFGLDAVLVGPAALALRRFYTAPEAYWKPLGHQGDRGRPGSDRPVTVSAQRRS